MVVYVFCKLLRLFICVFCKSYYYVLRGLSPVEIVDPPLPDDALVRKVVVPTHSFSYRLSFAERPSSDSVSV